jgi:predicted TIM-barrel fold metal-dependent hydrolase
MLGALGLRRAVIVQPSFYGTDNRRTYDAVAESRGQWRGVAVIPPDTPRQDVRRLHDAGFRGVRIALVYKGGLSVDAMEETADLIAPFGWHLQLLLDGRELVELAPRLRKLPVPIVVDHMGRVPAQLGVQHPGFQALLALMGEGNCWVKLSGPYIASGQGYPYNDVAPMAQALAGAAPERIVWGSDWPHTALKGPMPIDATLLDLLGTWVPDIAVRNRILTENPAKLYDF